MKRSLILLSSLCAAAVVCGQGRGMKAPVVSVAKVVNIMDVENRNYVGTILSPSVVQIVPRVSGEIIEVGFEDGAVVRKGQLLYRLDPVRYEAAVKGVEAKIKECQARLDYAQKNYDRGIALFQKKAESKDTMENRKSTLEAARAALMAAEAELIMAKDDLKNTRIIAPIDGIAGVSSTSLGNFLTPGSGVLVTIVKVQPIRVRFSISTNDYLNSYGSLKALQDFATVKVRLSDGKMYPVEGKVKFLNNEANTRTDAIQVFAEFSNKDLRLINGSTVAVSLSKKVGKQIAAVPLSAVVYDNKGACVYVVDSQNKAKKQYFVPGGSNKTHQFVVSGLTAGQTVISAGTHKVVMDDMPIEIAKPAEK